MAPDGVLAERAATRLLALSGMHRLEVVDVAVGLVEVAVLVVIVAIPDVELRKIGIDLGGRPAGVDLRLPPGVGLVDQEAADVACTDDAAAVVAAVGRRVVRYGDP